MQQLAARKVTVLAMDCLPRTLSRAQKMDSLTSMASISGYRAVIEAANAFGRFFNGQVTAAGRSRPPRSSWPVRAAVSPPSAPRRTSAPCAAPTIPVPKWPTRWCRWAVNSSRSNTKRRARAAGGYAKVMSEGFRQAQREMYARQAKEVDIIITTALIPQAGIADMAGEQGGNCELTVPGESVVRQGVTIIGYTDLAEPAREAGLDALRHQPAAAHRGAVQDQRRPDQRQLRGRWPSVA